jgi:hypothetical protein
MMITCAIFFQRNAFYFHVWGVTIFLLVVLHKINLCYGKITNKFKVYEQIVITGGIVHAFVPLVGIFFPIAMFVHVGICFTVHILHVGQSYQVFTDIKMRDTNYIIILLAVNVMEFFVNLAYCLPNVISNRMFVVPLVVVEMSALLLSSLRLKSARSSVQAYEQVNQVPVEVIPFHRRVQMVVTSRIMVCIICAGTAGLLLAFNTYSFGIFMTGYPFLLLLNLLHFHDHTVTLHPQAFRLIGPISPFLLLTIAWLGVSHLIPQSITAILLIALSLPILTLNILKLHCIMGFHYSFLVALFGVAIYLVTLILYGLSLSNHRILKAFMVCAIVYTMAMMLTDLKLVKGRRVHVVGITESKNSSHVEEDDVEGGGMMNGKLSSKSHSDANLQTGAVLSTVSNNKHPGH